MAAPPAGTAAPAPPPVATEPLGPPDLDNARALGPDRGGLPENPWTGTVRADAARLLAALPAAPGTAGLRALQQALLLSAAPPPRDAPEPRLLAQRFARLLAMGDGAGALALIGSLPQGEQDRDEIRRVRLRAHLAEGERDPACAMIRTALGARRPDGFWRQADLICQLARGEGDAATVTVRALRGERQGERAVLALADTIGQGNEVRLSEPPRLDWLQAALVAAAPAATPFRLGAPSTLDRAPPEALRALAEAPALPVAFRLEAAMRGLAAGAIPAETGARLMLAEQFSNDERTTPAPLAAGRAFALAYQQAAAAAAGGDAARRAEALVRAHERVPGGMRRLAMARLLAPEAERLGRPGPALAATAPGIARILLEAGRIEPGLAWAELALDRAAEAPGAPAVTLWPLAWLARAGEVRADARLRTAWIAQQRRTREAQPGGRIAQLAALKLAAGDAEAAAALAKDAGGWLTLVGAMPARAGITAPLALRRAMAEAAAEGRAAEALALAIMAASAGPIGEIDPETLGAIAAALEKLGMGLAGRRLLVEAAIARGM
ncbi:MAG: hypothetical protein IT557_18980 [Alphaproteobacteria bacterium]|nr:hypothetical protein [Alphaproteobacteria bacterium]